MPGKHDPEKKFMSVSLKRELWYKLTQEAERCGIDRTSFVLSILQSDMDHKGVTLTPENQQKCDEEVKTERKRRRDSWSGYDDRVAKLRKDAAWSAKTNKKKTRTDKKGKK